MSYDRSVSADPHELRPETVWHLQMPQLRFGPDSIRELGFQLSDLGVGEDAHGLVVTDEVLSEIGHVDRVTDHLEDAGFTTTIWDGTEREPSIENVERCISFVREQTSDGGFDFYLGVGGGSCMDVAKTTRSVIANGGEILDYVAQPTGEGQALTESGPPLVLLPTTAGTGAEISPVAILSVEEKDIKEGISSNHVRADAAVLDPTLTTTLPAETTAKTAMDALGHAIEGYTTHPHDSLLRPSNPETRPVYAGRTELTEMFSEKAISLLSGNVRRAVHNGDDLEARSAMLKGALFGAIAGLTAGASLCHAMAYPVGNEYHTYHGETIAVLTPASTLGYNAASDPERFARIAGMLGADTDGLGTREAADRAREEYVRLQRDLNVVPSGLAELTGATVEDVDDLARRTVESQDRLLRVNPRPVTQEDVAAIYRDALHNWET
ncbi:hydroxyacid-oxoacid transhydrogenase [Halalkalicoccus ordinarius]|uniref:hydroxyacid-oxoacid transhydrogenase n=1 Tax=Halalkalicoccus ordinarius TaxID=3116651 RepID=UPI00300EDC1D